MRIYTNRRSPDLRSGLLGLLLAALDTEPSDVWLITPWLRDIRFPIADHGHFASVFGGHRDEVGLSEFLLRLARRHHVHVVSKPFDELIPLDTVRRIDELLGDRDSLLDEELRIYEAAERAAVALGDEIADLGRRVTAHAETVALLGRLAEQGVVVHVVPRLHAKLLWTPAGAVLGSANFTHGGFARNEELMAEVSMPDQLADLREAAESFARAGLELSVYSLRPALGHVGLTAERFRSFAARFGDEPVLHEVAALVELVGPHS